MPLHRRGEMVTVIHPIDLKDDAARAAKCDVGDILLILKYRPIEPPSDPWGSPVKCADDLCIYRFLDARARVLNGKVWRDHLRTLE